MTSLVGVNEGQADDINVTGTTGTLELPADGGDGRAAAQFGDRTFYGTVVNGQVSLLLLTRFSGFGSCQAMSVQQIDGDLRSGHLTYTYADTPVTGGCRGSAARGEVRVE